MHAKSVYYVFPEKSRDFNTFSAYLPIIYFSTRHQRGKVKRDITVEKKIIPVA